jgi:hypothetical protein
MSMNFDWQVSMAVLGQVMQPTLLWYRLQNSHLGAKQHLTTLSFNLTANHWRKILSVTTGMLGRWNDKTVVLFDRFVCGMYEGGTLLFHCFSFSVHLSNPMSVTYFLQELWYQSLHLNSWKGCLYRSNLKCILSRAMVDF